MITELTKQFVKKVTMKMFIFTALLVIVSAISQAVSPIVTNELALGQMQNSSEAYILMNTVGGVKSLFTLTHSCIILVYLYTLGKDSYKFIKTINTEINKEN